MNKAPAFDEFWRAYPLHKARLEAERAWNRLSARDKRLALAALPAYTADCQQRGVAFKYAQGWLNGHRWTDEEEAEPQERKVQDGEPEQGTTTTPGHGTRNLKPETSGDTAPGALADMEQW